MEQRHPHSSTASSSHRRRRRNGAALFIATAAALAVQVQHASAAVMVGNGNSNGGINARHINHHSLQSRQYPSEAPGELLMVHIHQVLPTLTLLYNIACSLRSDVYQSED